MGTGELIYPPAKSRMETPPVNAVRGFVFTSGVRWMEQHGVLERFTDLLPEHLKDHVRTLTPTEWIPIDFALNVYATCDALNLSIDEQLAIGRFVVMANNGVVLNTVVRLIGKMSSPWTALQYCDSLWQRSNRGGAIAVYKLNEKSARLEYWNVPLARSRFFVTSMRGSVAAGFEPFCGGKVVVAEVADSMRPDTFALRLAW